MRSDERRKLIIERPSFRRHDTIQHLAEEFGVSWLTIHRDIRYLKEEYPIITTSRNGGGMVLPRSAAKISGGEMNLDNRTACRLKGYRRYGLYAMTRMTGERTHILKAAQRCLQIRGERQRRRKRSDGVCE